MPRPTWETERRVKPDIWRGTGSSLTEEERSSNSFYVERRSHPASLSVELNQESSSSTSDVDDQPGAFAINRDGADPLTLDWDQSESVDICESQSKPLESSTRDDILPFYVENNGRKSDAQPEVRTPFSCEKLKKRCKYLYTFSMVIFLLVVAIVLLMVIWLKFKSKNNAHFAPIDKCDFSFRSATSQIDPILQCACQEKVEYILESVNYAYEDIRNAANMTGEYFDIHECTAENLALLWVASEFYLTPEKSLGEYSMEKYINRLGLAILYLSWDGDNWNEKANWMTSASECLWFGVLCDKDKGIVALELSNNNLNGVLGTELRLMQSLEKIDLSLNRLHGTIQDGWWTLSNLG
jgi:hypothetical protein